MKEGMATIIVDTAVLWTMVVGSTLLIGKHAFTTWRQYRSRMRALFEIFTGLRIRPGNALSEMDSPGSQFDGALMPYQQGAPQEGPPQEGQVFLREFRRREMMLEEKQLKCQEDYNNHVQGVQIGMDHRDQKKNEELDELRLEVQRNQATIIKQNKFTVEITNHDNREETLKNDENRSGRKHTETDATHEYDKQAGAGSWKGGHEKMVKGVAHIFVPSSSFVAASCNLVNPRNAMEDHVNTWIRDSLDHGGTIVGRNVLTDGGHNIHNWGKLIRSRMNELGVQEQDNNNGKADSKCIGNEDGSDTDMFTRGGRSKCGINYLNLRRGNDDGDGPEDEDNGDVIAN